MRRLFDSGPSGAKRRRVPILAMNTYKLSFSMLVLAAGILVGCSQEQEDRAAQQSAQAVREGNQALKDLSAKARDGTDRAASAVKEGAREAGAVVKEGAREAGAAMKEGAREAGAALSDGMITAKVKSALIADRAIDASRIDVDTHGAVVTLSGRLSDTAMAARAVDIARAVEGVKSVENRLEAG